MPGLHPGGGPPGKPGGGMPGRICTAAIWMLLICCNEICKEQSNASSWTNLQYHFTDVPGAAKLASFTQNNSIMILCEHITT